MADAGLVVTGATGFIGRHVLEAFQDEYRIWALSRSAPGLRGIMLPATVRWLSVDIARPRDVAEAFAAIRRQGGAEVLLHLAAHYDFTGERHPEYERTNVAGTAHLLERAADLGVHDFVFASSVAACAFPEAGAAITETSPPDGDTPYAESKRAGEEMLARYQEQFRCWRVRFAAIYSDWCEYEPLFRFMETWLGPRPRSLLLAGCGLSAVPYLHIRDAMTCLRRLLASREQLDPELPVLMSPDGATTHLELFRAATSAHFGERARPLLVPRPLCRVALRLRELLGHATGIHAFERPWMGRFIDRQLTVDSHLTRSRLAWAPRGRLQILRRMPFLVHNRKASVAEWQRRNHAAMATVRGHENREIVALLQERRESIARSLTEYALDPRRAHLFPALRTLGEESQHADNLLLLAALERAIRTGEKGHFRTACRDLVTARRREDVPAAEVLAILDILGDICVLSLADHDPSRSWSVALYDHVTMTVQFGADVVFDLMEQNSEPPATLHSRETA